MAYLSACLRNIYLNGDQFRLLTDVDWFLQRIAQSYQPEWKSDCKLLERAVRQGAGKVIWQYLSQNDRPDAAGTAQFSSQLQSRAGFSANDANRMLAYLYYMVGWSGTAPDLPQVATPTSSPSAAQRKQYANPQQPSKPAMNMSKVADGLTSTPGKMFVVVLLYGIWIGAFAFAANVQAQSQVPIAVLAIISLVFGWKVMSSIPMPRILVIMPIIGWLLFFAYKALFAVLVGVVVTPYQIAKILFVRM